MFKWGFKRVSRTFQWCFKSVSEVFQAGCLKIVLFLTVCFREVERCSWKVLRVFQINFKGVSKLFQRCFLELSRGFSEC